MKKIFHIIFSKILLPAILIYILGMFIFSVTLSVKESKNKALTEDPKSKIRLEIVNYAKTYLNKENLIEKLKEKKRYDCSGFTQQVFEHSGLIITRTSSGQYKNSFKPDSIKVADLVFFSKVNKNISHVGIYLGDSTFIHLSGDQKVVKINKITDSGWNDMNFSFGSYIDSLKKN